MLSDRLAMKKQTECTRAQCAAEHLKRVAALTGAKQDDDGTYHLTVLADGTCTGYAGGGGPRSI